MTRHGCRALRTPRTVNRGLSVRTVRHLLQRLRQQGPEALAPSYRPLPAPREGSLQALYDELVQLQKLIGKSSKRLHRDALELGRRFYAEPSKAFGKRISIFMDKRKAKS